MFEPGVFRPSRVLGLLLCAVIGSFSGFVMWQWALSLTDPRQLTAPQWVLALGAFTAMLGWMSSALVTVRNSVKQHTINTLLQTRLSATYMDRAKLITDTFGKPGAEIKQLPADYEKSLPVEVMNAVRYHLNYFEFIAVGIRHGDLDEQLMRSTLRGILVAQCALTKPLIDNYRKDAGGKPTRTFEHLLWLLERWKDPYRVQYDNAGAALLGLLLAVMLAFGTKKSLQELAVRPSNAQLQAQDPPPTISADNIGGAQSPAAPALAPKPAASVPALGASGQKK
jgi:hypothetical protein